MTDPFQNILQAGNRPVNHFPVTSRYYRIETSTFESSDGKNITYLRRRFIPPADNLTVISVHQVKGGDRLDNIAASYIGDPEQFWQIGDANEAMKPEELTEDIGRELRIAQPQGMSAI
jgi:hypothetical protein